MRANPPYPVQKYIEDYGLYVEAKRFSDMRDEGVLETMTDRLGIQRLT